MSADQLTGILRVVLGMFAGWLVKAGYDGEMVNWVFAGIIGVITALWSWWSNKPGKTIEAI